MSEISRSRILPLPRAAERYKEPSPEVIISLQTRRSKTAVKHPGKPQTKYVAPGTSTNKPSRHRSTGARQNVSCRLKPPSLERPVAATRLTPLVWSRDTAAGEGAAAPVPAIPDEAGSELSPSCPPGTGLPPPPARARSPQSGASPPPPLPPRGRLEGAVPTAPGGPHPPPQPPGRGRDERKAAAVRGTGVNITSPLPLLLLRVSPHQLGAAHLSSAAARAAGTRHSAWRGGEGELLSRRRCRRLPAVQRWHHREDGGTRDLRR